MQEIAEELNNKGMSLNKLNTLNNEYEQKIQELRKELIDKEISLNKYKERLDTLNSIYEKEFKKIKNILVVMKNIKIK